MSIGDALAQARSQAGLTITQVSQRTRIRETIVRGIEHDDFSACGGDFYARGHIRSIARVVGVDSEPLIHEYDTTHGAPAGDQGRGRLRAGHADQAEGAALAQLEPGDDRRAGPGGGVRRVPGGGGGGLTGHHAAVAAPLEPPHVGRRPPHSPTPTPTPPTHASHTVVIRLTAIEDCWVGFTTPAGTYLSQDYVVGGAPRPGRSDTR